MICEKTAPFEYVCTPRDIVTASVCTLSVPQWKCTGRLYSLSSRNVNNYTEAWMKRKFYSRISYIFNVFESKRKTREKCIYVNIILYGILDINALSKLAFQYVLFTAHTAGEKSNWFLFDKFKRKIRRNNRLGFEVFSIYR